MQSDGTQFIPSPDDEEFTGRFEHFGPWGVWVTLLAFALLAVALAYQLPPKEINRESLAGAREVLARAVDSDAEESVILLGDSVLRGKVMQAHGIEDWERWSVAAHMRRLMHRGAKVEITDLSYDGLLPGDLLALLILLEESDPEGRVQVVIELSPRYLSRAYSTPELAFSREFLRSVLDPEKVEELQLDLAYFEDRFALTKHRLGLNPIREQLPIAVRSPEDILRPDLGSPAVAQEESQQLRQEVHRGRVLPHFVDVDSSIANVQARHLAAIGNLLGSSGRRALFFITPLDEEYLLPGGDAQRVINSAVGMRRLVRAGEADSEQRFLNFNDYSFGNEQFLDHCHLTPVGNQHLAQRLMRALALPLENEPPQTIAAEDLSAPQAYVLGAMDLGCADGVGDQVRFGESKSVVEVRPGVLYVADRSNTRICEVHVASRTSVTLFDAGSSQIASPFASPEFLPGPLLADGQGGAYFLDLATSLLGQIDAAGQIREVPVSTPWHNQGLQLMLAHMGSGLLVYEQSLGVFYRVDLSAGVVQKLEHLEPMPGLRSIAQDSTGRLLALSGAGNLISLDLRDAGSKRVKRISLVRDFDRSEAEAYWDEVMKSAGVDAKARLYPMDPQQIFCAGDSVYISDHLGDFHFCWRLRVESNAGGPLLVPGRDGYMLLGLEQRLLQAGSWTASADGMLYWLSDSSSLLFRLQEHLFGRLDWSYEDQEARLRLDTIANHGLSYTSRRKDHYRLGLFGSSLVGSNKEDLLPVSLVSVRQEQGLEGKSLTANALSTTRNLAMTLGRSLRSAFAGHRIATDVLDFSRGWATMPQQYVSLVALDPMEIDLAIFSLDRQMIRSAPAREVRDPGEQWRRLARDERGLPKVAWINGNIPTPAWLSPEEGLPVGTDSIQSAVLECLSEMLDYCASRNIRCAFLDLIPLDSKTGFGLEVLEPEERELSRKIKALLRERGVMHLEPGAEFLAHSGARFPFSGSGDHHLLGTGQEDLAAFVVSRLRRDIELDLFQLDRALAERRRIAPSFDSKVIVAARLGASALDMELAAGHGVKSDKLRVLRSAGDITVVLELEDDPPREAWRTALAAYGLGAAASAREGDRVGIRLVRYANHDEYGSGVEDSVENLGRFRLDASQLETALEDLESALEQANRPSWLMLETQ